MLIFLVNQERNKCLRLLIGDYKMKHVVNIRGCNESTSDVLVSGF